MQNNYTSCHEINELLDFDFDLEKSEPSFLSQLSMSKEQMQHRGSMQARHQDISIQSIQAAFLEIDNIELQSKDERNSTFANYREIVEAALAKEQVAHNIHLLSELTRIILSHVSQ